MRILFQNIFQKSWAVETRLSVFHKVTVTVLTHIIKNKNLKLVVTKTDKFVLIQDVNEENVKNISKIEHLKIG